MEEIEPRFLPWQADTLQRALTLAGQGHLPHAVMIDTPGERDISDFALYLSMLLLCDQPDGLQLCESCDACRMMSAGTYADFRMVTLELNEKTKNLNKNIKIEQIRNLIHEVSLTHQYERLKIAVIYPAEAMSTASANALLKTLEEPAPRTLLLLLTHNRGRIPVTLRSRCQSWSIKPPSRASAMTWLKQQGIDETAATRYLDYANGDPVLAMHLQQQDYGSLVEQFKSRFSGFLRGELGVSSLCRDLLKFETAMLRRLVNMTLNAYCYQMSGLDGAGNASSVGDRHSARQLLDLRLRAQNQLRIEENNLDLQLQLEDVLISLKQILTRRLI